MNIRGAELPAQNHREGGGQQGQLLQSRLLGLFPGLLCESEARGDWGCPDLSADPYFVWHQVLVLPCKGWVECSRELTWMAVT